MKNPAKIVILPTIDKISDFYRSLASNTLFTNFTTVDKQSNYTDIKYQHLYFINNNEIKEGDWFLCEYGNSKGIRQAIKSSSFEFLNKEKRFHKIIATTNPELLVNKEKVKEFPESIYDYPIIAKIPTDFIEYFVQKQGKVDEVMLEYYCTYGIACSTELHNHKWALKLNPAGEVIWSVKENKKYTSTEVKIFCAEYALYMKQGGKLTVTEWFNKNYPQ